MYKMILMLLLVTIYQTGFAQKGERFSVKWNGKEILKNKTIREQTPYKCIIKKTAALPHNLITITMVSNEKLPNWHRVIIINDENDMEMSRNVQKTSSGVFTIKIHLPVDYKKGTIKFQSLLEPDDANQAALVRLRTFPLFNLTIE